MGKGGFGFLKNTSPKPSQGRGMIPTSAEAITSNGGGVGGGLLSTNNLSDVASAPAARANLGIVALLSLSVLFGDGATTVFVIPHGMGSANVVPMVKKVSSNDFVDVELKADVTNVTITFAVAPALNSYRLIAVGF